MITNTTATQVVSTIGWVDRGALWVCAVGDLSPRKISLSDTKWLHIKKGRDDFFAVVHHWGGEKLEISAHSHSEPARVVSRISLHRTTSGPPAITWEGERFVWEQLPHAFSAYTRFSQFVSFGEFQLVVVNDSQDIELQRLEWFDDSYDKGYQGIVDVTEVPDSSLVIVSIQRDSAPVLHDPIKKQAVRKLHLANRGGNPEFYLRSAAKEFWVADYDYMVKLNAETFEVLGAERIQTAASGTRQFIGNFCFNLDESLCLVARPFGGDVAFLDTASMRRTHRIELRRQPLDVGLLADGTVVARDWKTGDFMCFR